MLLSAFKQNTPFAQIATIIIWALAVVSFFWPPFSTVYTANNAPTPLFTLVMGWIDSNIIKGVVAIVLLLIETGVALALTTNFELSRIKYPLFSVVYVLTATSFVPINTLLPEQMASIFILLSLFKIFSAHGWDDAAYKFFDAGLLIGIAILFSANAMFMIVVMLVTLAIFRPYKTREWIISLVGIITPAFFYFTIYFVVKGSLVSVLEQYSNWIHISNPYIINRNSIACGIVFLLCLIFAAVPMLGRIAKMNVLGSKAYWLLFAMFITACIQTSLPFATYGAAHFIVLPIVMCLSNIFQTCNNTIANNIVFIVYVLAMLTLQALWF